MAHRQDQKQARRAARQQRERAARRREQRARLIRKAGYGVVGVIAATLVTLAVVLSGGGSSSGSSAHSMSASDGPGPTVGAPAPSFTLTDVVSNRQVALSSLAGRKTLLFFSEGVSCQACMVQAADLQNNSALGRAGVRLVSVTTDAPGDLAQAAREYGIRTPLLADPTTRMSAAYGMLGHGGMGHPTQDGHAFMLLDARGRVLWHQSYQEMYVKPGQLLADMGLKA